MECVGGMFFQDYKLTVLASMIEPPRAVVEEEGKFKPARVSSDFAANKRVEQLILKLSNVMTRARVNKKQRVGRKEFKLIDVRSLATKNSSVANWEKRLNKKALREVRNNNLMDYINETEEQFTLEQAESVQGPELPSLKLPSQREIKPELSLVELTHRKNNLSQKSKFLRSPLHPGRVLQNAKLLTLGKNSPDSHLQEIGRAKKHHGHE